MLAAIEMRAKLNTFFGEFSQIGQRKYLKTARIRQERTIPRGKFMQPAKRSNGLDARSQKKMVCVA